MTPEEEAFLIGLNVGYGHGRWSGPTQLASGVFKEAIEEYRIFRSLGYDFRDIAGTNDQHGWWKLEGHGKGARLVERETISIPTLSEGGK